MAKSFFFEMLSQANYFKIIFVIEHESFNATRCQIFRETLTEIQKLIVGFEVTKDCGIIITKTPE